MIVDFAVPFGEALLQDQYVGADSNRVLYLHGAGRSSRHGHRLLRGLCSSVASAAPALIA
jgi:hypothetical protein